MVVFLVAQYECEHQELHMSVNVIDVLGPDQRKRRAINPSSHSVLSLATDSGCCPRVQQEILPGHGGLLLEIQQTRILTFFHK